MASPSEKSDPARVALVARLRALADQCGTEAHLAERDGLRTRMSVWLNGAEQSIREAADALSRPVAAPPLEEKYQRACQRWGNLKRRIKDEILLFSSETLTPQQRSQYANGVARLNWVLHEMEKSSDVLAESVAAPPDGTLTREQAETRLTDEVLDCVGDVYVEPLRLIANRRKAARGILLAALFPHDGSRT